MKGNPVSEILLGYKKVGFGQGKFTGIGGKVEPGEAVIHAAQRELTEETGVTVTPAALELVAVLEFRFPYKAELEHLVHVFTARTWEGIPAESREIRPRWFPLEAIPYPKMWDDAHYWLPRVLDGEKLEAKFIFNRDNATVDEVTFKPLG